MNSNYNIIYKSSDGFWYWRTHILRIMIPDKVYFYDLFVGVPVGINRYLPLRPYMNNTGFKL